jgi:hypothetical protein
MARIAAGVRRTKGSDSISRKTGESLLRQIFQGVVPPSLRGFVESSESAPRRGGLVSFGLGAIKSPFESKKISVAHRFGFLWAIGVMFRPFLSVTKRLLGNAFKVTEKNFSKKAR